MKSPEQAWAEARTGRNMSDMARQLRISRQALYGWKRVPEHRLRMVSRLTGWTREDLRPDLHPADPWSALSKEIS